MLVELGALKTWKYYMRLHSRLSLGCMSRIGFRCERKIMNTIFVKYLTWKNMQSAPEQQHSQYELFFGNSNWKCFNENINLLRKRLMISFEIVCTIEIDGIFCVNIVVDIEKLPSTTDYNGLALWLTNFCAKNRHKQCPNKLYPWNVHATNNKTNIWEKNMKSLLQVDYVVYWTGLRVCVCMIFFQLITAHFYLLELSRHIVTQTHFGCSTNRVFSLNYIFSAWMEKTS